MRTEPHHPLRGLDHLEVGRFQIHMRALDTITFSEFASNEFRGQFGNAFRDLACTERDDQTGQPRETCPGCPRLAGCDYVSVFDPSDMPRAYAWDAFGLDFRTVGPGETFSIYLTLIGNLIERLDSFLTLLLGVGLSRRRRFEIARVTAHDGSCVFSYGDDGVSATPPRWSAGEILQTLGDEEAPTSLRLQFVTPTMWKAGGRLARDIVFRDLVRTAASRVADLLRFYGGVEANFDFKRLLSQAEEVRANAGYVYLTSIRRYSVSQRQWISFEGFVGEATFTSHESLAEFVPLFRTAERTHMGRGTGWGLGKIRLHLRSSAT